MKKMTFLLALLLFCSWQMVYAQKTITGKVTDASDGTPLPGASVTVKGTTVGTITNLDGDYTVSASAGQVLIATFVGYAPQEVTIGDATVYNIAMSAAEEQLGEVVVTALGIAKEQKTIGYSITQVEGKEVAQSSTISAVQSLQGKVAGVDIARLEGGVFGGTRINIRGNSTLRDNNQPIFVVDGVIIENQISGGSQWGGSDWGNDLKNLNADNFESVSVLKGAAATALYGSRALNGAIVITTKKGKERKGLGVSIKQQLNFKKVYDGPAFQNVYGEGPMNGWAGTYDPNNDPFANQNYFVVNNEGEPILEGAYGWIPYCWGHKMDGTRVRDWDNEWINYDPQPDNFIQAFENGLYSNTNLTLDGGSQNSTFLISASNTSEKGIYPKNKFKRTDLFTRVTHKINNYLSADVGLSYANSLSANPPVNLAQRFIDWFPRNYNTNKWKDVYKAAHGGVPSEDYGDPNFQIIGNDLWFSALENSYETTDETVRINGKISAKVTSWLEVVLEGYLNNTYSKYEAKELGQGYANEGGYYELSHSKKTQYDYKLWINMEKDLTEDIHGRLSLGGELWNIKRSFTNAWTNGGLIVPGQFTLTNSKTEAGQKAGIADSKALNSIYFFADFSWKDQVFLSLTGRNDWSSTLTYSDGRGNNSYFYPSVSTSWLFSETFALPEFISFGKLRVSYAHVGNDYTPYSINPGFTSQGMLHSLNGDIPMYSFNSNRVPNLDLRPERKKSFEIGTDIRFLQNRIGLDFTYYKDNTIDQILPIPVPSESGVSSQVINAGNIQNQGVEISLKTTPVKIGDFQWDVDIIYTRNRNKIIDLYPGVTQYYLYESPDYGNTRVGTLAVVGGDYGILMSDSKPAVYTNPDNANDPNNGKPLLLWNDTRRGAYMNRSGVIQEVGNINPDFTGSVSTAVSWKGLSARLLFDIKIGGDISTYSGRYGVAYGLYESSLDYRDTEYGGLTWTSGYTGNTYNDGIIPDGVFADGTVIDGHNVGGMSYQEAVDGGLAEPTHASFWTYRNNSWSTGIINDNVVQENSYIGIRELAIDYSLPKKITDKLHLGFVQITLFGRDIGFLYKTLKDNLNPFSIRGNQAGAAHEWQQEPYVRTLGFTLNVGI